MRNSGYEDGSRRSCGIPDTAQDPLGLSSSGSVSIPEILARGRRCGVRTILRWGYPCASWTSSRGPKLRNMSTTYSLEPTYSSKVSLQGHDLRRCVTPVDHGIDDDLCSYGRIRFNITCSSGGVHVPIRVFHEHTSLAPHVQRAD